MKRREAVLTGLGLAMSHRSCAAMLFASAERAAQVLQSATQSGQIESAALYVRHGQREFNRAFGEASSVDASFLLASISKPITVAAIMPLFDDGEFRLDDPVQKFIPAFRGDGRERVTMQQLFTHCSGLPDQLPENARLRAAHAPLSEFVSDAIKTPLLFAPGSKFGYSSMGILLASEVARRISRKSIAELIATNVCRPLKMTRSALGVGHLKRKSLVRCQTEQAAPESGAGNADTKSWDWNSDYWRQLGVPWGGAHGSAGDVARFLTEFLAPQGIVVKPETARMMIRNHNSIGMRARGLGFDLGKRLGGPPRENVFGHSGSTGTLCWADPTTSSVCVILTTLPGRAANPHPRSVASRHIAESIEE
ncbi:MAG TPA: serine hydrolase [Planctomycetaceae bacterium]|nr:serine hydrolase [Planctomycetaceae bacterium]